MSLGGITFKQLPLRSLRPVFRRADMLVRFEVSRFEVDCARGADKNVPRPIICPTVTVLGKSKMGTTKP